MSANEGALKATLRFGKPAEPALASVSSVTSTLAGVAPGAAPIDLGETLDAAAFEAQRSTPSTTATSAGRTTVLPRRARGAAAAASEERARFDRVRLLGEGGMGQVELVKDNDIRRTVAVKRLHADAQSEEALLRFADEVRIVGQLEHPAIVPVYDVGRDDAGQVYLVMKHLNGETMEQIIEKLREGNPEYIAQYTHEYRVHLFLSVLDAIRYAHARGVIHRDIKPANIMIGPYGEVTVLDWGIAKPIKRAPADGAASVEPLERTLVDTNDPRLQETQLGALAGTPLYMSPEQAAGRNDELDERSDVYTLSLVLFEWLSLLHPFSDKKTVPEVLAAIISGDPAAGAITFEGIKRGVSAEYMNIVERGLAKNRDERIRSVADLERSLRDVLDGKVLVECHVTLTKRAAYELLHWIDRHPMTYFVLFRVVTVLLVAGLAYGGYRVVRAFV